MIDSGTPAQALQAWLRGGSGAPALTWYGRGGARTELSGASLRNAVAKAVGLFRDELLLPRGGTVVVDLPFHWQAPVLAIGAWAAGLAVALPGSQHPEPDAVLGTGGPVPPGEALAVSLHPWGMPLGPETPPGWQDAAALLRMQPDDTSFTWPADQAPWLFGSAATPASPTVLDGAALAERAMGYIESWQVPPRGRLLSALATASIVGILAATVVPAYVSGSVVLAAAGDLHEISQHEGNAAAASIV